jgi:endonuclease G
MTTMAAPASEYSFDLEAARKAAHVWRENESSREHKRKNLDRHLYDAVEPKERLAKRANRLLAQVQDATPAGPKALPDELRELIERGPLNADEIDNVLFERVVGATRDFLSVSFLGKGTQVIRCAARIVTSLGAGRVSYGTGCLVSPRLLLTNYHVLPKPEDAINTLVEFDYQVDLAGNPLRVQRFALDPSMFFFNDKDLDYTLVAVAERSDTGELLGGYGWCPLYKEEGKIVLGNCVNIIQHPHGEMKQIVIRENRLVDLLADVLHYEGDTEPGSSGSPVFNDQWEIVGLHHSGVPKIDEHGNFLDIEDKIWRKGDDPQLIQWIANEGIRASRIVGHIEGAKLRDHENRLRDQLLSASQLLPQVPMPVSPPTPTIPTLPTVEGTGKRSIESSSTMTNATPGVTVTIPLHVTVSLGYPDQALTTSDTAIAPTTGSVVGPEPPETLLESITPDPNYDDRPGYDPNFLGFSIPMPELQASIQRDAVEIDGNTEKAQFELKYFHYSVIMNRKRRIAFVAAVNLNDRAKFHHDREGKDRWFFDPRIDESLQAGDEFYTQNKLDRGHLVRRADSAWGSTAKAAKLANDDTFHFTNCSPQHEIYNQSAKASSKHLLLWGNLENHVAKQAKASSDGKLCVFNGPILRLNDPLHRGLRVPKEFWKIIVYKRDSGKPGAVAFLLSQTQLIKNLPEEEFEAEEYRPFQVRVQEIEKKTKLDFGKLSTFDPLTIGVHESLFETDTEAVPLETLGEVIL